MKVRQPSGQKKKMTIDERLGCLAGNVDMLAGALAWRDNQIAGHDRRIEAVTQVDERMQSKIDSLAE
jgi:hypothetical protein